jgi:ribosomal protein S12 methylthiotransferase accessory factor
VFLGPSLPSTEARSLLAADYRPPLRRGDLDAIAAPAVVAVVDGVLEPEARLPPEEARRAAGRGLRLFGAASVGALIAADPSIPGSVAGVGRVFRLLRRGRARAEDVALLYAPHDLRPLTVPVVDVLCRLDAAVASGRVPPGAAAAALAALRALPLEDRAPAAVARLLRHHLGPTSPGLGDPPGSGAKAADARRLLRILRALLVRARGPAHRTQRCGSSPRPG